MADPIDTPIGQIDPDNPPTGEEVRIMAELAGQRIGEDFSEHLRAFLQERVLPFAEFLSNECGTNPSIIWRSMGDLLRAAASGLDAVSDDLDARDWPASQG